MAPITTHAKLSIAGILSIVAALSPSSVCADLPCAYLNDEGQVQQVTSPEKAPSRYRSRVICATNLAQPIPKTQDVELDGLVRKASFASELGPIDVRWQRSDEECFGKSPSRAVADAAQAVNRAIKSARFPLDLKTSSRSWSLVFLTKDVAISQFPSALAIGGHPGFMVPPNQIYLVTDFIAPDCGNGIVGDAVLAQVLLHEMGHVIEYLLLGNAMSFDRERAEGFASWFEQYASDYSGMIPNGSVKSYYRQLASQALTSGPSTFSGSPQDYARAALRMQAIVERRGIGGLMDVYRLMREQHINFNDAVQRSLRWNRDALEKEMKALVAE